MTTGLRQTVIQIVNRVERALSVNESTNLTDNKLTTVILDTLNEVLDDISDYGDWEEMYREVEVTAVSSTGSYEVAVSGLVKNIYEIHFGTQISPLEVRETQDLRRLQKLASYGEPRQFAVVGVNASSGNPLFRVYPVPGSAQTVSAKTFDIAYYQKPEIYATTTAAAAETVPLPANLVYQGVYANMLLKENGGQPTQEFQAEFAKYERMKREALNRFRADTGNDLYINPTGHRW